MLENVLKELGRFMAEDGELAMDLTMLYGIALKYRRVHDALDDDDACANAETAVQCFRNVCKPPPSEYAGPVVFFERRVLTLLTTRQDAMVRFLALISAHADTDADFNLACRTLTRVADIAVGVADGIASDASASVNDVSRTLADFKLRVASCMSMFMAV
jgi:hypothetical protein